MDPISQARFDTLRKTDQANWTDADREFMTARRGYLPSDEVEVLGLDKAPATPTSESAPSEPAPAPAAQPGKSKKTAAQ